MTSSRSIVGNGLPEVAETGKDGISRPESASHGLAEVVETLMVQSQQHRGVDTMEGDSLPAREPGAEETKRTRVVVGNPVDDVPERERRIDKSNWKRLNAGGRSAPRRPSNALAYKISEAAQLVGISESSVRRAIKSGDLKVIRRFRHILIPASELERFLSVED
jgi:excisionase family DNA binding protein